MTCSVPAAVGACELDDELDDGLVDELDDGLDDELDEGLDDGLDDAAPVDP